MSIRLNTRAALIVSAAFVLPVLILGSPVHAQAPIIDASVDNAATAQRRTTPPPIAPESRRVTPSSDADSRYDTSAASSPESSVAADAGAAQGELFYQMQLLQQEVMLLRGIVEEQTHQLKQLKEKNMERYIDVDRRISELVQRPSTDPASRASGSNTAAAGNIPRSGSTVVPIDEKEAYDAAYALVSSKRFDEALAAFNQFLVDYPVGKYAPNSYYWMGELYQVVKPQDLEAARQSFVQLLDQYPDHSKAPDAMYKLGKVYYLKDNKRKAREWLEKVIADYGRSSNSSAANKARQFISANL